MYSTYFLLINCEKILKFALTVSAGYVCNFLEAHVKFLVFWMTQRRKKEVVSSTVMFDFSICNILQAQLSVCRKSSDPFVCFGADCIKSSTAVFRTKETFYLVAPWTHIQEQICLHVAYCFTPGAEFKF